MGLYKGIGAVVTGIVPKMAIRFASFEGTFLPLPGTGISAIPFQSTLLHATTTTTTDHVFLSFLGYHEIAYKNALSDADGKLKPKGVFLAGLLAGATEAVLVVSPMEVVKIRLQAQQHSLADPLDIPKYRYVEDVVDRGLLLRVGKRGNEGGKKELIRVFWAG
jgi:solute carrier family 25 citrate transporter 1